MNSITLTRKKDYMIFFRALKIYVNNEFVDYFESDEKVKIINVEKGSELKIKVDWCFSNSIKISNKEDQKQSFKISSQIHNGLFIIIFGCFILGNVFKIFDLVNPYMYIALVSPISIIVGWQIFGRNNYLRLTKVTN